MSRSHGSSLPFVIIFRILAAAFLPVSLTLVAGCSGKPPEISRVFAQRMLIHDVVNSTYSEKLSVFVVGSDPDGMDDLADLYVINDVAELFWSVDNKSWMNSTAQGETWIGTNGIAMPGGKPFPEGTYRVVLEDRGGDTAEESFTLAAESVEPAKAAYPTVTVKDGEIKVSRGFLNPELWVYAKDGSFILRLAMSGSPNSSPSTSGAPNAAVLRPGAVIAENAPQPITLQAIAAANPALGQGFSYWAYGLDTRSGCGMLVGPYASGKVQGQ
jgi:hypothetical protein